MKNLLFFDSTLRDGSHAIKHQLSKDNIASYCKAIDDAGLYCVLIGHGNGLGASSLQVGISKLEDEEMITIGRENLQKTKLGAFLIPGFGTIKNNLKPAIQWGVDIFCVAAHCSEADVTKQHIEFLKSQEKEVYGVLMMYHMIPTQQLVQEALKMKDYGANGILIMDSAGASTPDLVKRTIQSLVDHLDIKIGFHPHNNLGLGVANAYIAIQEGASIIDGTLRGFGAGAGNCQLEALVALLEKVEIKTKLDLYKLLNVSEEIVTKIQETNVGVSALSIISGQAGVFSSFAPHVKKAAQKFGISPLDIFVELGKRKVVGGQEDVIIEVANNLKKKQNKDLSIYQIESLS